MNLLTDLIEVWAKDKELDKALPEKQMLKLMEEVIDSIGDVYVVLTILSMQLGLDIRECVEEAYEEIKGRQGRMVNGVFVKQEDLHD